MRGTAKSSSTYFGLTPLTRRFAVPAPFVWTGDVVNTHSEDENGKISFKRRRLSVGKGFRGYPVTLRPTEKDEPWDVFF